MMTIRALDLVASLMALILLLPFLAAIMIILKLTGEGEIIYRQKRVGLEGKEFFVLKFATMLKESPNLAGGAITVSDDPRVLPVGQFLRKTKINELPQLFNILKGDMSIVGPRPLMKKQYGFYSDRARAKISSVRPGLTGVGSVYFRDEERYFSPSSDPDQIYRTLISPIKERLEVWYIDNRNVTLYFRIIWATIAAVLWNENQVFEIVDEDTREFISELQASSRQQP